MYISYRIEFICKHDYIQLIGDEKNIRKLMHHIICEESRTNLISIEKIKSTFPELNINTLITILKVSCKNFNYYLNDFSLLDLTLHLAILLDRNLSGNSLADHHYLDEHHIPKEFPLVDTIIDTIQNEFDIIFNEYETSEIYLLIAANINYTPPSTKDELINIIGDDLLTLCEFYVTKIEALYKIDLSNKSFLIPFALHVKNLLFRIEHGKSLKNPMISIIKYNNPIIFDIAIFIASDLTEKYKTTISEDEATFLAMHIGAEVERQNLNLRKVNTIVLSPNYQNTNNELVNTLLINFGNQINIIDVLSNENELGRISNDYFSKFSLLLSTIPLINTYDYTTIYISPFSIRSQLFTIQNTLTNLQDFYQNFQLINNFDLFFEEDLFVYNSEPTDKDTVINELCSKLFQKGYVNKDFMTNVNYREGMAPTNFHNISIPHSIEMDAIKPAIAVGVFPNGVLWNDSIVYLVLLLANNKADTTTFQDLYESLISIFTDDRLLLDVKNCTEFIRFKSLVITSSC